MRGAGRESQPPGRHGWPVGQRTDQIRERIVVRVWVLGFALREGKAGGRRTWWCSSRGAVGVLGVLAMRPSTASWRRVACGVPGSVGGRLWRQCPQCHGGQSNTMVAGVRRRDGGGDRLLVVRRAKDCPGDQLPLRAPASRG